MTDRRLPSPPAAPERLAALAELRRMDETLELMAGWLGGCGEEQAAQLLEEAWRAVTSAGWVIMRDGGLEPARRSANGLHAGF